MSQTCLVCNAPHLEMIGILRHPRELDFMLKFLLGLQANGDDYLCKTCCDEVINAFDSRHKSHQFNLVELEPHALTSDCVVIKEEVDPGNQIENAVSAKDQVVKIEPESDDLEKGLMVNDGSTHVGCDNMLKPDLNLKLGAELQSGADNEYKSAAQRSFWAAVSGSTESSWNVSQEAFNIVTPNTACEQNDKDCWNWEYFKREKSVDIEDKTEEDKLYSERTVNNSESNELARAARKKKPTIHCEVCDRPYRQILSLQNHLKREHPDITVNNQSILKNRYKCSHCSKTFRNTYYTQVHERMHANETPHICVECGKGFTSPSSLKSHRRIHIEEKPYKCSLCPKTFVCSSTQKRHVRRHTSPVPYH